VKPRQYNKFKVQNRRGVSIYNELSLLCGLVFGVVVGIRHAMRTGLILQGVGVGFLYAILGYIAIMVLLIMLSMVYFLISIVLQKIRRDECQDLSNDQD
jgi:uncharacterized membrane protein